MLIQRAAYDAIYAASTREAKDISLLPITARTFARAPLSSVLIAFAFFIISLFHFRLFISFFLYLRAVCEARPASRNISSSTALRLACSPC